MQDNVSIDEILIKKINKKKTTHVLEKVNSVDGINMAFISIRPFAY